MDLPYQVAMLYALIQCFGPNQVVGIPALKDPLENLSFERAFFSETLNSCLSSPYILQFIIIHKVPTSSLPLWHTLPQVISSGWEQCRYCNWWPLFQRYQFNPPYPKKGTHDTADSCTTGPLLVKGLFKTITFSRRTGRKIKPSNRRPIKTIKVSKRTIKLSRSNTWGPVRGGSKLNKSSNEGGPARGRQQKANKDTS